MESTSLENSSQIQTEKTSEKRKSFHISAYVLALFALIIGIILGYFYNAEAPQVKVRTISNPVSTEEITIPKDAVIVSQCSNTQGTVYMRPNDIPNGPLYMVNKGKVIGLEYMVNKDQLIAGHRLDNLLGFNMKVDHINVYYEPEGHAGNIMPHFHIDYYTVSRATEQQIACSDQQSKNSMDMMNMNTTSTPPAISTTPSISNPQTMPSMSGQMH